MCDKFLIKFAKKIVLQQIFFCITPFRHWVANLVQIQSGKFALRGGDIPCTGEISPARGRYPLHGGDIPCTGEISPAQC